jgi:DNA polymerase-3 subunit epsilon
MARLVVLDTELTGLDIDTGDRIIAVGLVEIFNGKITGVEKEWFMNPEGRNSHPDAAKVHGITDAFLKNQPVLEMSRRKFSISLMVTKLFTIVGMIK